MKLSKPTVGALALALVSSSGLATGCGGGTPSRTTLPQLPADEASLLELAPSDAYFVARLDLRELRASSSWDLVEARLATADEAERSIANGTDRVYLAVGGLIDPGPLPPQYDENGAYVSRPDWASIAQGLHGRLPSGVVIVEGASASLCRTIIDGLETTSDTHGFHHGTKDGIVLATRGSDFCALTWEPVWEHLIADATTPSPAARRLMAVARGGSLGTASMAFELDSPGFREVIANVGPSPSAERPQDERWAVIARGSLEILLDGLAAIEWEVRSTPRGFESIGRLQSSHHDRGVMWRELSDIYVRITNLVLQNTDLPASRRESLERYFGTIQLEPQPDGFIARSEITADTIARIFEELPPGEQLSEVVATPDLHALVYTLNGEASDTISRVEPRLAELAALDPEPRSSILVSLAEAYRYVGRYDDARALLTERIAASGNDASIELPRLSGALCQLELELGNGAPARRAAEAGLEACAQGSSECSGERAALLGCKALAMSALGEVDAAVALLRDPAENLDDGSALTIRTALAGVFLRANRTAEASGIADNLCVGRTYLTHCATLFLIQARLLARSGSSPAAIEEGLSGIETRLVRDSNLRVASEVELAFRSIRADAASRSVGSTDETKALCAETYAAVSEAYGVEHPRTLVALLAVARAAKARRDTAELTSSLQRVDALLAHLGPNAVERADRAALGGNTGRRQR